MVDVESGILPRYRGDWMQKERILVVEDDDDIAELVKYNLEKEGYRTTVVSNGELALKKVRTDPPSLVVLDLMLPGIDGLTVCREMRADPATRNIPILMLTAKSSEADVVAGLEVGADDYVTKPFSPRVLLARVRARLRKGEGGSVEEGILKRREIEINEAKHLVAVKGKAVKLSHTEFKLLHFLAKRPGVVFSRYQIVDAVHGADYPVTDRSVDVQIVSLRKKLGACGDCIETIRGVGYKFKDDGR
jgi:two-component system, OmpR family, alkaline phosphatase synthesis response regulator PhoP